MSERYTKLFTLPENRYSEGAPVVISAGALLKDNQTGRVLVQLKIKSISNETIKAARVKIYQFDTVGNPIGETTETKYLDLIVHRDEEFGQKEPIMLANSSTRAFKAVVSEIIFFGNSIWRDSGNEWFSLVHQKNLDEKLNNDPQLLKQYEIEYGKQCKFEIAEDRDLWLCSCGNINHNDEKACHKCGCELEILKSVDMAELEEKKNIRLAEEKRQEEKERTTQKNKTKKAIKNSVAFVLIIVISITSGVFAVKYHQKNTIYKNAIALVEENKFGESVEFAKWTNEDLSKWLENYKQRFENEDPSQAELYKPFNEAISDFASLGNFKDSAEQTKEAKYQKALVYFINYDYFDYGNKDELIAELSSLGDYKDSADMLIYANFVAGLSESFANVSDTEIKKLAEKNAMAKNIYTVYNQYKPYCGTFECVTKGDLRKDKIESDFEYKGGNVLWNVTSKGTDDLTLTHVPFYDMDNDLNWYTYAKFYSDNYITNKATEVSISDTFYYGDIVNCTIKFKGNNIIYSSKYSKSNKTLALKYQKTK